MQNSKPCTIQRKCQQSSDSSQTGNAVPWEKANCRLGKMAKTPPHTHTQNNSSVGALPRTELIICWKLRDLPTCHNPRFTRSTTFLVSQCLSLPSRFLHLFCANHPFLSNPHPQHPRQCLVTGSPQYPSLGLTPDHQTHPCCSFYLYLFYPNKTRRALVRLEAAVMRVMRGLGWGGDNHVCWLQHGALPSLQSVF